MVIDKTGALANVKRHDYLPFGEELAGGQGVRSTTPGYSGVDGVRQKFTSQERDNETGLDYMHARYSSSAQGRFTSADTVAGSTGNPQSLNRYAYVNNNPMNLTDPTGHMPSIHTYSSTRDGSGGEWSWDDPTSPQAVLQAAGILPSDIIGSSQINDFPTGQSGNSKGDNPVGGSEGKAGGASGDSSAVAYVGLTETSLGVPQNPTKSLYQTCRESAFGGGDVFMGKHLPDEAMSYLLLAAGGTVNDSAFAASIVAKESDFTWRPTDDHGPAQLTTWWKNNQPQLIVGDAYDPFLRGTPKARARTFTGSPENNIMTLGNIVRFQRKHHAGNEYMMAKTYYSGPGDQDAYAKEILGRYEAYKPFFKCLGAK